MVHEQLYQTENVSTIDIGNYIRRLFEHLRYAHLQANQAVELHLEASRTAIGLELAVPLGLALNEIMTNSLKYAAGTTDPLLLSVKIRCEKNTRIVIDFCDNGYANQLYYCELGGELENLSFNIF
jgi:two-component sensor histidine kinase